MVAQTQNLMSKLVSNNYLETPFTWLCARRKDCLDRISISQDWPAFKENLRRSLLAGNYQFSPLDIIPKCDEHMMDKNIVYVCYMDDFILLTKTRHHLRRVVKQVYGILERMKLKLAHSKTFIGKISAGFDFLGYRFTVNGMQVSKTSETRMREKVLRLYEQGASSARIEVYLKRWLSWVKAGLGELIKDSIEPLTKTIHSIYNKVVLAKQHRLSKAWVAALILS